MGLKILVIRFSSIGDIVLTTPVLRVLHAQLDAEVHVLTKPAFAPLLAANPYVARVIPLSDDWNAMMRDLRKEAYDHIVDLHHNLRSLRVRLGLGRPSTAFRKLNFEKWLLVSTGINRLPRRHIVDRYLDTITGLGAIDDGHGLDFFIPSDKEVNTEASLGVKPGDYACIAVGAAHATKCMTAGQIAQLAQFLAMPVVLMGGPGDREKAAEILRLAGTSQVIDACGRFDILQSGSILRQSGPVINHDSGLMHIAAALQKPQVVVWGNTVPAFGMSAYYGKHKTEMVNAEVLGLRCRPCSKLGHATCPKGHFKCMVEQDLEGIAGFAKGCPRVVPSDNIV